MKQIIIAILILTTIFALASYLKKGDKMTVTNHYMIEKCTQDITSNSDLICD